MKNLRNISSFIAFFLFVIYAYFQHDTITFVVAILWLFITSLLVSLGKDNEVKFNPFSLIVGFLFIFYMMVTKQNNLLVFAYFFAGCTFLIDFVL